MASLAFFLACMLILIIHVHSLVLQPPVSITKPVAGSNGTIIDGIPFSQSSCSSSLPDTSATALTLSSIYPPEGFHVEYRNIPGGHALSKFDIWFSIVASLGWTALEKWDTEVFGQATYPDHSNVETTVISSVNIPRYQAKSIIWTLAYAFRFYNIEQQYTSMLLTTKMSDGPATLTLGLIRLKSLLRSGSSAVGNSSNPAPSTDVPLGAHPAPTPDPNDSSQPQLNASLDNAATSSASSTDAVKMAGLKYDDGFVLDLTYPSGGRTFGAKGFFTSIIEMLIFAASHDPKTGASGRVSTYNSDEDYTISVKPTSPAASDNLPWAKLIEIVASLPSAMWQTQRGGVWGELDGRARLNGAYIAKISIQRGDHTDRGGVPCMSWA